MRREIKEFIEQNIQLIETYDFEELYTKVSTDIFGDNIKGEVTQVLWDADIHPEKELINIPRSFANGCNSVSIIGEDYNHIHSFSDFSFDDSSVVTIDLSKSSCVSIGYGAFRLCSNLETVELPSSLRYIGGSAFAYCYKLRIINIPSQVTELSDTFINCKSLTTVVFEGTKQQFKAIRKNNRWRRGSGIKEIICSDGVLRFN